MKRVVDRRCTQRALGGIEVPVAGYGGVFAVYDDRIVGIERPIQIKQQSRIGGMYQRCVEYRRQRHCHSQRAHVPGDVALLLRSEEHTSELQSLMRISYAVFCLKKKQ